MKCEYCGLVNSRGVQRCMECGRPLLTPEERLKGKMNEDVDVISKSELAMVDSWLKETHHRREQIVALWHRVLSIFLNVKMMIWLIVALFCVGLAIFVSLYPEYVLWWLHLGKNPNPVVVEYHVDAF